MLFFSPCLEVLFCKNSLPIVEGEGGGEPHTSSHLLWLPLPVFEWQQGNIFYYYLNCYDNSVYLRLLPRDRKIYFRKIPLNLRIYTSIESRERERKAARSGGAAETALWRVPPARSFAERALGLPLLGAGASSTGVGALKPSLILRDRGAEMGD